MISLPLKPFIRVEWLKKLLTLSLALWAASTSVIAIRNRPQVILIGLDEAGTRVITSATDPIIAKERVRFIREFLRLSYRYDGTEYSQAMSQAGALMSDSLWREKEAEFRRIAENMKTSPLTQDARLLDLREVSEQEFEADLALHIRSRLQERNVKYRVGIRISTRKRSSENPYPFEVVEIHENEIQ